MTQTNKQQYEYAYECSECGHHEWRVEEPRLGANYCPECGCPMTDAAARRIDN